MSGLDRQLRLALEEVIDNLFKNPSEAESMFRDFLIAMGIEPNLERELSIFAGMALGHVMASSAVRYDRPRDRTNGVGS